VAEATPAQRRKLWENGVRQLAAVQKAPLSAVEFLAGPGGLRGFEQEWDKYARFVEWVSRERRWPVLDAALVHLRERWPKNRPEGLVWGDARLGNIMFDDNFEVVAVMDWEQPSLGGALQDLAWWLFISDMMHGTGGGRSQPLEGMGTREETIALWSEVCGKSAEDIEWYEDFMALKVACMSLRMFELEGAPPQDLSGLARRLGLRVAG
jgi:aminoglycoside phosphotransferase (APT) family kinase protein